VVTGVQTCALPIYVHAASFKSQMKPSSTHSTQRNLPGASSPTALDLSYLISSEMMPLNNNNKDDENSAPNIRPMKTRGSHVIQRTNSNSSSALLDDSFEPDAALRAAYKSNDTLPLAESGDENDTSSANVRTRMKPRSSHLIQRNYSSASSITLDDTRTTRRVSDIDYRLGRTGSPADNFDETAVVRTHMKPRSTHTIQRVHSGGSSADFAASVDSFSFSEQLSPSLKHGRSLPQYTSSYNDAVYTEDELNDGYLGRHQYSPVTGRRSMTPQSVTRRSPHRRSDSQPLLIEIEERHQQQPRSSRCRNIDDGDVVPLTVNQTRTTPKTLHSARGTPLTVGVRQPDGRDLVDDECTVISQSRETPSERLPSRPRSSSSRRTPLTVEVQLPQNTRSHRHHPSSSSMPNLADIEMNEDFETYQNIPRNKSRRRRRDPNVYVNAENENSDNASRRRPHSSIGTQDAKPTRRYRPRSTAGSSRRARISGIGVENGRHRGRRSWRTDDMPATDIEDLYDYDEVNGDSVNRRPRKHVAHIYIGDDDGQSRQSYPTNTLNSGFIEPVGRPKSSMSITQQPLVEYRKSVVSVNSSSASNRTPLSPLKFQHMDTQGSVLISDDLMSPDSSIAGIDPELRDARKSGTNYNITLTLKPLMTTPGTGTGTGTGSVFDQSFNHSLMMTTSREALSSSGVHQPFVSQTPVSYTQPNDPDSRRTHQYTDVILTDRGRALFSPSIVEVGSRPQSSAARPNGSQIGFDIEVESLSGSDVDEEFLLPTQRSSKPEKLASRRQHPTSSRKPQFEIPLLSSIDINYSPDQGESTQMNSKAWRNANGKHIPTVERQRFLVKNSLESTKPPKVKFHIRCSYSHSMIVFYVFIILLFAH